MPLEFGRRTASWRMRRCCSASWRTRRCSASWRSDAAVPPGGQTLQQLNQSSSEAPEQPPSALSHAPLPGSDQPLMSQRGVGTRRRYQTGLGSKVDGSVLQGSRKNRAGRRFFLCRGTSSIPRGPQHTNQSTAAPTVACRGSPVQPGSASSCSRQAYRWDRLHPAKQLAGRMQLWPHPEGGQRAMGG